MFFDILKNQKWIFPPYYITLIKLNLKVLHNNILVNWGCVCLRGYIVFLFLKWFILVYFDCLNILMSKINLKNKKIYYFDIA